MGRNSRFRILLNRRKYFNWENKTKLKIIVSGITIICLVLGITAIVNNVNFDSTKIIPIADSSINEEIRENLANLEVDIYTDVAENLEVNIYTDIAENPTTETFESLVNVEKNDIPLDGIVSENISKEEVTLDEKVNVEENVVENEKVYVEDTVVKDEITFTCTGEIMMGADVTENLDYQYSRAFKEVYKYTRYADFTYGILSTNITTLNEISNIKSRYLVTENIRTAFNSLGIDALNIATDHIIDYDKTIFVTTIDTLKNNNIYMTGINDSTLYVDVCGKKIAIIAALSSYVGNKSAYQEFGINLYDQNKMTEDIQIAKDNSDFVIVDVAWGRDTRFGETSQMRKIAYSAIDAGANLVLGSNALGTYPIVMYKNVPIIYSTGYLITDSDLTLAQRSFIWQFNINSENKVDKLIMVPTCTENKTNVAEFRISNPEICREYSSLINNWNNENGISSTLNDDSSITVNF